LPQVSVPPLLRKFRAQLGKRSLQVDFRGIVSALFSGETVDGMHILDGLDEEVRTQRVEFVRVDWGTEKD